MKTPIRYIVIVIGILAVVAFFYWQQNKKAIIKKSIRSAVSKETDSLYYIKYDSSVIDELNGNASFFNVVLQSDSLQQRIAADTSDNVIYRVRVGEIAVKGADIPGLLTGSNLQARSIEIINPDIQVTRTGNKANQSLSRNDSLALYEKILGKFKSIQAGEIIVKGGNLSFSKKNESPQTTLKKIDISIKNFRIDSTKDYANLVSYFVKGVVAKVGEVAVKNSGKGLLIFNDVVYDAGNRLIRIGNFRQKNNMGRIVSDLNNIAVNGLATNTFISEQKLIADELSSDGGLMTLYKKKNAKKEMDIKLDSSFFDKAVLNKIDVGKTKVLIFDRDKPAEAPAIINNVQFHAAEIPSITSGNTLKNIIANSKWVLSGDGFASETKDKLYKITIGPFMIDKDKSQVRVQKIWVTPQMTEVAFVNSRKVQQDLYELQLNNIMVKGANIKALLAERTLYADNVTLQPVLKIFNDRTLPRDLKSKIPSDPSQFIRNISEPFRINTITLKNGYISYREKGYLSAQIGKLFFDKFNATLKNVTNIPSALTKSPDLVLNAAAKFMGVGNFITKWILPLNSANGSFNMNGKLSSMDGLVLNAALEPQAMISVKKGQINSFKFQTTGNDITAHTTSTLLYNNLKLELLKKEADENDLKKKTALSFLANIIIRDENPHNGNVRENQVDYKRDSTRSFYYLVSQSFFLSVRKTITGKSNAN